MATRPSHAPGRGAIAGLAFLFCLPVLADPALSDRVREMYPGQSFILVEEPDKPPRLLLLYNPDDLRPAPAIVMPGDVDKAVLELADPDPDVREEALLSLADHDPIDVRHLVVSALQDPSPDVRDTAEAILEDMDDNDIKD